MVAVPEDVRRSLENAIPKAKITDVDSMGNGDNYNISVESEFFRSKSKIACHRAVYDALKGHLIHALSISTIVPEKCDE